MGDRPGETHTSHARSPSGQSLVVEGYFACWLVVLALDLAVGHPLPYHLVVAAQVRIASSTCCYGWRQQSRVESRQGLVQEISVREARVMFASLAVRLVAAKDAPAGTLGCLCRYRGSLLMVEDGKLGTVTAERYTVEGRLRGTVEIGVREPDFEASRIGVSDTQVASVRVDDSIARDQVRLCRQLTQLAGSRWTIPTFPGSVKGIQWWSSESEGTVVQRMAGLDVGARQKECVREASVELGCSVCSLSSRKNVCQKTLASSSFVPSQVSWAVAAR